MTTHNARRSMPYVPALDGVRGVAILTVMLWHLRLIGGGFLGVDIFFVLSGFLITSVLLGEAATGQIDLRRFYVRRVRRLMPALIVYVVVCGAVAWWWHPWRAVVIAMGGALTYTTNLLRLFGNDDPTLVFAHTWSLSIEEQFYLLWPPVMALAVRYRRRGMTLAAIAGAGTFAAIGLRHYLWEGVASVSRFYFALDTRLDALLMGALAALFVGRLRPNRWYGVAAIIASASIVMAVIVRWELRTLYLVASPVLNLAVVAVILGIKLAPQGLIATGLGVRPLVWLGRISYSLYLWHFGVIRLMPDIPMLWQIVGSFGLASLSYYVVERPLLSGGPTRRWLKREEDRGGPARAAASPT
jgi:peptidoglycan/LPS O-acetylase OafA/YrhL